MFVIFQLIFYPLCLTLLHTPLNVDDTARKALLLKFLLKFRFWKEETLLSSPSRRSEEDLWMKKKM